MASVDVLGCKSLGSSGLVLVMDMFMFIMVKSMTVRLGEIDATRGDLTSMGQGPNKVRAVRQKDIGSEWKRCKW